MNKETNEKEIKDALKKIKSGSKKSKLADFFGALPGVFGDGLKYQKKVRSDWD
ncbi:hypothetical protein [Pedobacter roseus]|uniref:Uncharacterized protein n=1 Tax=Pedobacter roseus TaxID=336820 RepID=A0A7G9QL99_9SPHI|nr:hypothetical protein [Pedobacter roseus]QNN44124.1 hypothetical protein H9L23_08635 [Pedobacter roseus]